MSQQYELFYDDENEAIRACVHALGGFKKVGSELWPEKPADKAGQRLMDSLNDSLAQKLGFSEGLLIMKKARDIGCHVAIAHILSECNYQSPIPIEPDDKKNALQRDFIEAVKVTQQLAKQIGALS